MYREWNATGNDSMGLSGGFLLLWKKLIHIRILDISTRWIVFTIDLDYIGMCVMIWGEPNQALRNDL